MVGRQAFSIEMVPFYGTFVSFQGPFVTRVGTHLVVVSLVVFFGAKQAWTDPTYQ